jgi:hypothetical protein
LVGIRSFSNSIGARYTNYPFDVSLLAVDLHSVKTALKMAMIFFSKDVTPQEVMTFIDQKLRFYRNTFRDITNLNKRNLESFKTEPKKRCMKVRNLHGQQLFDNTNAKKKKDEQLEIA